MARYMYFMKDDATANPISGEICEDNSILWFKSFGWKKNDPAPAFEIIFEPIFDNAWNKTQSDKPNGNTGVAGRTWTSDSSGNFQRIKLKLKSSVSHPEEGYKYTVKMGSETWDPRVVPRCWASNSASGASMSTGGRHRFK